MSKNTKIKRFANIQLASKTGIIRVDEQEQWLKDNNFNKPTKKHMNIDQLIAHIRGLMVNTEACPATIKAYGEVLVMFNKLTCCKREVSKECDEEDEEV
jgi:hypothetical protein